MHITTVMIKEAMSFKASKKGYMGGLGGVNGRKTWYDYILTSKKKTKK